MDSIVQDAPISGYFLSDHATVLFNLKGSKSESSAKQLWSTQDFAATEKLLNQTADTPFLPHGDKLALANDMGLLFMLFMLCRKYQIFVLALMQLRICAALLTAILLIVLRPLLLFAV